jgi:hypothetical protein
MNFMQNAYREIRVEVAGTEYIRIYLLLVKLHMVYISQGRRLYNVKCKDE